jgi:hypothetical protein
MSGRRKPYTDRGISRVPCSRCGQPSTQQWQVCATGNRWFGCCTRCDIELNRLALDFMQVPDAEALVRQYALAAGTRRAETTEELARAEGCQSGHAQQGNAHNPPLIGPSHDYKS